MMCVFIFCVQRPFFEFKTIYIYYYIESSEKCVAFFALELDSKFYNGTEFIQYFIDSLLTKENILLYPVNLFNFKMTQL